MPQFAANLSLLYTELPFLERFAAAAHDGFTAVEYLFPYAWQPEVLTQVLQRHGLQQVLFNAPAGGNTPAAVNAAWDAGERGTLCLPHAQAAFEYGLQQALYYAQALQCPRVHLMSGCLPPHLPPSDARDVVLRRLHWAAQRAQAAGVVLCLEPLNPADVPSYYLQTQAHAHDLVQAVGSAHLQVQMDLYHCQRVEGDALAQLAHYLPSGRIAHIQIAGTPDRHEPDSGTLDYRAVFALLNRHAYPGWVGCEYHPRSGTRAGLGWRTRLQSARTTPTA